MSMRNPAAALLVVVAFGGLPVAFAQSVQNSVGRQPTLEEMRAADSGVGPDGLELPAGGGSAVTGKPIYEARCASCHGATGKEGPENVLVGGRDTLNMEKPFKTVGSYWPYATTVWDYINRTMPFNTPGSLTGDQVYATTAYLLFLNGIIGEQDVMDAKTLPAVIMPNRNGFIPDPRPRAGGAAQQSGRKHH